MLRNCQKKKEKKTKTKTINPFKIPDKCLDIELLRGVIGGELSLWTDASCNAVN